MKAILEALAKYLLLLLIPGIFGALFLVLDLLDAVKWFAPYYTFPRWLESLLSPSSLLMLILVITSAFVYVRQVQKEQSLRNRIAELEAREASLHLEVIKNGFSPAGTSTLRPFPDIEVNSFGYDEHGVPGWAYIWAEIRIENRGYEPGRLAYDFDRDKTILPPVFDRGFVFDDASNGIFFEELSRHIEGRTSNEAHLRLGVKIIERNPQSFAQALSSLDKYCIVMDYYTEPVVGEPRLQTSPLHIEGDFEDFRLKILDNWKHKHPDLVQLAESG
jgi:hypothetical protein